MPSAIASVLVPRPAPSAVKLPSISVVRLDFPISIGREDGDADVCFAVCGPLSFSFRSAFRSVYDLRGAVPASSVTLVRYCFVNILRFRFRPGDSLWAGFRGFGYLGCGTWGFRPKFLQGLIMIDAAHRWPRGILVLTLWYLGPTFGPYPNTVYRACDCGPSAENRYAPLVVCPLPGKLGKFGIRVNWGDYELWSGRLPFRTCLHWGQPIGPDTKTVNRACLC